MKTIYEILYGSDAYGTTAGDSDRDIRGILLPSLDEVFSMRPMEDIREEKKNEHGITIEDRVMYPIRKFFELAVKSNPSEAVSQPPFCSLKFLY